VMVCAIAGSAVSAAASMTAALIIFDRVLPLERTADNRAIQPTDAFIVDPRSPLCDIYGAGNYRLSPEFLTDRRTELRTASLVASVH